MPWATFNTLKMIYNVYSNQNKLLNNVIFKGQEYKLIMIKDTSCCSKHKNTIWIAMALWSPLSQKVSSLGLPLPYLWVTWGWSGGLNEVLYHLNCNNEPGPHLRMAANLPKKVLNVAIEFWRLLIYPRTLQTMCNRRHSKTSIQVCANISRVLKSILNLTFKKWI